ncbi:MAG: Gfo/Idh/MocA family protein [Flavobacteriales bacterium]
MRRLDFLKIGSLFGIGSALGTIASARQTTTPHADWTSKIEAAGITGSAFDLKAEKIDRVRVAIIGLGNRGQSLIEMLQWLVQEGHAEITAISDINPTKIETAKERISAFQSKQPATFTGSDASWQDAMRIEVADLALICTPWEWHAQMAKTAMNNGLHAASEVPIAYTVEDSLELIQIAEATKRHCIMLENCCYNREELWILNMIQAGVFGTLTHAECAYLHDLRQLMIDPTYYEDRWRLKHHLQRNGNLYTTHGLGPVCMYFDILRGDTLTHLTSMSSREAALSEALKNTSDAELKEMGKRVQCGDVNTTLIGTAKGRSIMLQFDVHSGRPYNRLDKVIGSKATHYGYPSRLYIDEGPHWGGHAWLDGSEKSEYMDRYEHPVWNRLQQLAADHEQGHGGMDFIMMYRLIRCLNLGESLDLNVYDGALWSLVGALSEESVKLGSSRVDIPDLTNGRWKESMPHPVHRDWI